MCVFHLAFVYLVRPSLSGGRVDGMRRLHSGTVDASIPQTRMRALDSKRQSHEDAAVPPTLRCRSECGADGLPFP